MQNDVPAGGSVDIQLFSPPVDTVADTDLKIGCTIVGTAGSDDRRCTAAARPRSSQGGRSS